MDKLKTTTKKAARVLVKFFKSKRGGKFSAKKTFWSGLVVPVIIAAMFLVFLQPKETKAQWVVSDPGALAQSIGKAIVDTTRYIASQAAKLAEKAYKTVGDVAFKNALKVFLGKIAEDTATWIASSGKGQGPLFPDTENYFKDLGQAAAGDFLDTLAKDKFGVSLCDPGAAKLQIDLALRVNLNPSWCQQSCQKNYDDGTNTLEITIGPANDTFKSSLSAARTALKGLIEEKAKGGSLTFGSCRGSWDIDACMQYYQEAIANGEEKLQSDLKLCNNLCSAQRRKASCTLNQITENIKNNGSITLTHREVISQLPKIFKPEENQLGQFLVLSQQADAAALEKTQIEKEIRTDTYGIGPLRSLISGGIKTPATITSSAAKEGTSVQNSGSLFGIYTGSPVADAIGIFTNTLTNKLLERIFNKGIADPKAKSLVFNPASGSNAAGGVQAAKERFASLSQINFGTGGGIDILNDLASCPTDVTTSTSSSPSAVGQNNCVIDQAFQQAIQQKLTVKEAIEKGLLTDKKVFGFDANGREPDYRNGYPYRSLIILRKYRVIPVGWELAAEYIRDYEKQNVSISTIINQFDNPSSPYFRLIDPSWVLKAPDNLCLRTGYVEDVVSDEYVDADGDESGIKNIDYSKRYCNSDSDSNINKECICNTVAEQNDKTIPDCISSSNIANDKDHCFVDSTAASAEDITTKKTCSFITPRTEQIQRREACVDERTCIMENDDGSCKQYGSCVEEKDVWRFNGQSCNEQYASCQTFISSSGEQASYLQNSTQKSLCSPENAGCQQYCTAYDFSANKWSCDETVTNTKRFDRDVEACDESANGCTAFIRQTTGTNLLSNGNFEQNKILNPANQTEFTGWYTGGGQTCGAQTFALSPSFDGSHAAKIQYLPPCVGPDPGTYFTHAINLGTAIGKRNFTISFYGKAEGKACSPAIHLATAGQPYADADTDPNTAGAQAFAFTEEWQRFSFDLDHTFPIWPKDLTNESFTLFFRTTPTCTYFIDNVQVEEGSLTDYKDYGATNLVNLKRPPSSPGYDLGCTGDPITDPPACSNYIAKCTKDDVGCDLYTPADGGLAVPAKGGVSCPKDKVGCKAFRETSTEGGILQNNPTRTGRYCQSQLKDPNFKFVSCSTDAECGGVVGDCQPLVAFIAKTGQSCQASDVGCEAFTNLDEVAKGGEGKAQFTKLQLCVRPDDPQLANYYSWVGDSETGYQLKQYRLKQSNINPGPCTNLQVTGTVNAPCVDALATRAVCLASEVGVNPDCAEFYDDDANTYYLLRSRTIEGTESCQPFRNAVDNQTYYADSQKSLACSPAAVGCREYIGNTGNNIHQLLTNDFEKGTYAPWSFSGAPTNPSTESVSFGGHSLQADLAGASAQAQAVLDGLLKQDSSYTVSFWAKSQVGDVSLESLLSSSGGQQSFGQVTIKSDWNQFTLGPLKFSQTVDGTNELLTLTASQGFFIDNVTLTEITENIYQIKGSQTACGGYEGCQEYRNRSGQVQYLSGFERLCQSNKVGCEALINTQNSSNAFAETSSLPNLRGDTDGNGKIENADNDYLMDYLFLGGPSPKPLESGDVNNDGTLNAVDVTYLLNYLNKIGSAPVSAAYSSDEVSVSADTVEYWVNDPQKACSAADKGCRSFGRETFKQGEQVPAVGSNSYGLQSTETIYLKDNPDNYSKILCGREALFCDEFTTPEGGKAYFRNPGNRTCEYKENSANQVAGWYLSGTSDKCDTWDLNGLPPEIPYGGQVGLCPAEQSGCGSFLDPLGTGESILANGSFELQEGGIPIGWTVGGVAVQLLEVHSGSRAVRAILTGTDSLYQTISLKANTFYVLSADVEADSSAPVQDAVMQLRNCRDSLGNQIKVSSPDNSMTASSEGARMLVPKDRFNDNSYRRVSGRFYSGRALTCEVTFGSDSSVGDYWFDNVEVKETSASAVIRQSVDSKSCNGAVGDKLGCRLFNDMSNPGLTYDVDLSPVGAKPTDLDASGSPATCADQPETCDSNVVLKVSRDRTCAKWLAPTSTFESIKPNGQKENLSTGLATCDSMSPGGQCNHFVDEKRCSNNPKKTCVTDIDCGGGNTCKPFTITGDSQAYTREELRNRSGLVVAGLDWKNGKIIEGKYPYGIAPQIGNDGSTVEDTTINGNFDESLSLTNSGWFLKDYSLAQNDQAEIVSTETLDSGKNVAPRSINPYLKVTPSGTSNGHMVRTTSGVLANNVSPEKTYMISFKAKFLQAPDKNILPTVGERSIGVGFGTGPSTGAVGNNNTWWASAEASTEWQKFVAGPFKLSASASQTEGNYCGLLFCPPPGTHSSFDPHTGYIFFQTTGANLAGYVVDEVSILPVLQVDDSSTSMWSKVSGDTYIARSCRSYPNATALSCGYQDDTGKKFEGWKGYCLEPDPKNPSACLSWYPVDLIDGERNIFGQVTAAGYVDKAPLYMCLQSSGNYNRPVDGVTIFNGNMVSSASPIYNQSFKYRKPAKTKIHGRTDTINSYSYDSNWYGISGGCSDGNGCIIWEDAGLTKTVSADPEDQLFKSEIEKIAIISQLSSVANWNPSSGSTGVSWGPTAYTGDTLDGSVYMILDESTSSPDCAPNSWCASWVGAPETSCTIPLTGNTLTFAVNFDPITQRVSSFSIYGGDDCGGGGIAATVMFYLNEQCTEIAKVVDTNGDNAAWSENVASSSFALPNFKYKLGQEDQPYGSIAQPEGEPTIWDILDVRQNILTARAGSAYSCNGNCGGRSCVLPNSVTSGSYSCDNLADISACIGAGGYCNGFGPAKICVSGSRVNAACYSDADCGGLAGQCDYGYGVRYCSAVSSDSTRKVGDTCSVNTDCGTTGVCSNINNASGGVYASRNALGAETADQQILRTQRRLQLLFANVNDIWKWDYADSAYEAVPYSASPPTEWDWRSRYESMQECGTAGFSRSNMQANPENAYCGVKPEVANVTIGAQTSGNVFVQDGEIVQLKFNSIVDSQQTPLRNIAIDWNGDPLETNDNQQIIWGFAPKSDPKDPHSFSRVYRFGPDSGTCYDSNSADPAVRGPYADNLNVIGHEYCVGKPGVQIQDNWQWCNGGRCLSAPNNFPSGNAAYWQYYSGNVIVIR